MSNHQQMSINRHDKQKEKTRKRLMQSAMTLFLDKGYDNVSIAEIAEHADVGRATFYLHFTDKLDLATAIMNQNAHLMVDMTNDDVKHMPMRERSYYSWLKMFKVVQTQAHAYAALIGKDTLEIMQRNRDYVVALYRENIELGYYELGLDLPAEFVANIIAGALLQILTWWIGTNFVYTPQQMAEMMYLLVFRESASFDTEI